GRVAAGLRGGHGPPPALHAAARAGRAADRGAPPRRGRRADGAVPLGGGAAVTGPAGRAPGGAAVAFDLEGYLAARRRAVDEALARHLPPATAYPPTIHEAMRYSVFAGGKR